MKKLFTIFSLVLLALVLSACTGKTKGKFDYKDGVYFAIQERTENQTYRYWVTVTIKDKKITNVTWDAYHVDGAAVNCRGDSKMVCSEKGNYGMNANNGEWYLQAKRVTDWIVANQKIGNEIEIKDNGKTDAIASVSITVKELFDLIDEALENEPVEKGDYKDGYYYVETELADKTVKYAVLKEGTTDEYLVFEETFKTSTMGTFLVVNGTIVLADINARHDAYIYETNTDGSFKKYTVVVDEEQNKTESYNIIKGTGKLENGKVTLTGAKKFVTKDSAGKWYGMSDTGKVEWNIQVQNIEKLLLENQGLTIKDGKIEGLNTTDANTGATLGASSMNGIINVWNQFYNKAAK